MSDCQNMENPVSTASGHNAIQSSAADPITVTKVEAAPISEADFPSTSSSAYLNNPSTTTPASANPSTAVQLVTRSGLWLIAKDTDGTPYYYHRDTRETRWDLPPGEELIDLNAAAPCNEDSLQNSLVLQQRRAEFKRQVSALVAKCIESYRKITHKVLDSQEGNKELLFNIQVQKNTRRLVDDYIKHFKVRESGVGHQIPT
uniref:WW domain-containing protein n=1 Tax=Meloidogyne hapla TaxID=6305 RepID=A0A1I8BHD1_MELHA